MKYILISVLSLFSTAYGDAGHDFVHNGVCPGELKTEEYLELVKPYLPANPYILEAGAHSGEDTVIIAKTWPKGAVFAFEPVPKFYDNLLNNIKCHNVTNVIAYPFGLFTTTGDHTFYYSQKCGGASSFLPDNGVVNYEDITVTLPCKNLDEWAIDNRIDHIDFMWLDMEGAEYYVLSAAPNTLKNTKVILTEINFREFRKGSTQYAVLKEYLESQGFVLEKIWGSPNWQATGLFIKG